MKKSSVQVVMEALVSLWNEDKGFMVYGPRVVKRSGLSSSTVYGALLELTVTGMVEHRYHGGPYRPTDKTIGLVKSSTSTPSEDAASHGGVGSGRG